MKRNLTPQDNFTVTSQRADRKVKPDLAVYRYLTFDEIDAIKSAQSHLTLTDTAGKTVRVKITSIKKWKTRPDEIDIHCKYGLHEYFTIHAHRGHKINEVLIEEECHADPNCEEYAVKLVAHSQHLETGLPCCAKHIKALEETGAKVVFVTPALDVV